MASERQIEANRSNAARSTGPKTAPGKARSAQNAFRHGLSRPLDEALGAAAMAEIEREAIGFELQDIVLAKLELARVRMVRHQLLAAILQNPDPKAAKRLLGLERYERAAFARQKRIIRARR